MQANIRRALLLLGALMAVAVFAQPQNPVVDRIVAIVDNDIILESELLQYVQYNIGSQAMLDSLSPAQLDTIKQQVLSELIKQKVLLAKAHADTMIVEMRDVDKELDARIKTLIDQAGGQQRLEEYYGMPLVKLKRQFRPLVEEGLLIEKVRQEKMRSVQVGPIEVQRFWETYQDSIPPLRDGVRLAHILLADRISQSSIDAAIAKADSVRAQLVSGTVSFEEYASRHSDDAASASKGGKLGLTNRGDLVPAYEAVAYALKPGEISPPVVSPFGVHLIRLEERLGEKISSSHILFKVVPSPEDLAATEARADSLIQAVKNGADWDVLARDFSTDKKSAPTGGDLGWFQPSEIPPDFVDALKDLQKGDLAKPVRTRFGVHVLRVTDRVFARPITLKDDYDRIARLAQAKKQDEAFDKWVKELAAETYIERK